MIKPLRIAFAAKQRSGKDVAAEYLLTLFPGNIKKFADPLYDIMYRIQDYLGIPRHKDRLLLQAIGTHGRDRDKDIWVNTLFSSISLDTNDSIFITDARFHNEFARIKKHNFILIKIETLDCIRVKRGAVHTDHESEKDMDEYTDYDYIIENNGTVDEFRNKLFDIVATLQNK